MQTEKPEKPDPSKILDPAFKDASGRWGGESRRDAEQMVFDRWGEPVIKIEHPPSPRWENPYCR